MRLFDSWGLRFGRLGCRSRCCCSGLVRGIAFMQKLTEGSKVVFKRLALRTVIERGSGMKNGKHLEFASTLHGTMESRDTNLSF